MAASDPVQRKKAIHSLAVKVFVYGTEDESRVCQALRLIVPESVQIDRESLTGHFGNSIVILSARTKKTAAIRAIFDGIRNRLSSSDLNELREHILQHLSKTCTLVVKFDKQAAAGGVLQLDTRDPIVLRAKIAAYPARIDKATEIARDLLNHAQVC
jgi:RNA binding exosome subunit